MNTNTMELNMNEMELANGAGLIDWIVIKIGMPLAKDWDKTWYGETTEIRAIPKNMKRLTN